MSGFAKADKIKPVITLAVYFGTEEWDAPRCLKDMFGDIDEEILQFVSDYKLNLLIPKEIKDFSKFQTEFGKVMKYISVADREDGYKLIMDERPYNEVTYETARLLNECVGLEFPVPKGDDNVKVCKAVEGIKAEGRLEGVQVLIDTLRELNQSEEYIIDKIMNKFQLSEDEVKEIMK